MAAAFALARADNVAVAVGADSHDTSTTPSTITASVLHFRHETLVPSMVVAKNAVANTLSCEIAVNTLAFTRARAG